MSTVLRMGFLFLIFSVFQQANETGTYLRPLWDTPGYIVDISPDSQHVILSQENTTRLLSIEKGEIIAEVNDGRFDFSPSGRYVVEYSYDLPHSKITDLQTGNTLVLNRNVIAYSDNEQFITVYQQNDAATDELYRLINLHSGDIVAEFTGGVTFSPDTRLAVVTDLEDSSHITTQVIELATKKVLAQYAFDDSIPDKSLWGVYSKFHADSRYLSINYFPSELHVIDTSTWEILYRVSIGIGFSPDGNYAITLNDDSNSDVQLMEASSGRVLDTVFGAYGFSDDSRYLFRIESVTYDLRHLQLIDLTTNQTIFEHEGYIGSSRLVTDTLLEFWDRGTQSTRYYDITSGVLVREVEGGAEWHYPFLIVGDLQTQILSLRLWESEETIVEGRQVEVTPNGEYVLVADGLIVNVYAVEHTEP